MGLATKIDRAVNKVQYSLIKIDGIVVTRSFGLAHKQKALSSFLSPSNANNDDTVCVYKVLVAHSKRSEWAPRVLRKVPRPKDSRRKAPLLVKGRERIQKVV